MDKGNGNAYSTHMASIMTVKEQRQAGRAARRVGGYMKLIELQSQRRQTRGARATDADSVESEQDGASAVVANRLNSPQAG